MTVNNVDYGKSVKVVYTNDERRGQTETHYNNKGEKILSIYRYDKNEDGEFTDNEITHVTTYNGSFQGGAQIAMTWVDEDKNGTADAQQFTIIKDDGSLYRPLGTKDYGNMPEKDKVTMAEVAKAAKLDVGA